MWGMIQIQIRIHVSFIFLKLLFGTCIGDSEILSPLVTLDYDMVLSSSKRYKQ